MRRGLIPVIILPSGRLRVEFTDLIDFEPPPRLQKNHSKSQGNIFYVVCSTYVVKFGVTSARLGSNRIKTHRRDGLTTVLRHGRCPDAFRLERNILGACLDCDYVPVRGKEYFDIAALPLIIDIVDGWTDLPLLDRTTQPLLTLTA